MTTFYVPDLHEDSVRLSDDAAHHVRVKRMSVGDEVVVTDGAGARGEGVIASIDKKAVVVDVAKRSTVPRPSELNLFVPVADKDRMLWVAEKATELQITSWTPVMYERSKSVSPRGEGDAFERKVLARMVAALEQSGGSWLPEVKEAVDVTELRSRKGIVFDGSGQPVSRWAAIGFRNIAIGPEGGFTAGELDGLLASGWTAASLGDVTLRFETAAISAVAIARALT